MWGWDALSLWLFCILKCSHIEIYFADFLIYDSAFLLSLPSSRVQCPVRFWNWSANDASAFRSCLAMCRTLNDTLAVAFSPSWYLTCPATWPPYPFSLLSHRLVHVPVHSHPRVGGNRLIDSGSLCGLSLRLARTDWEASASASSSPGQNVPRPAMNSFSRLKNSRLKTTIHLPFKGLNYHWHLFAISLCIISLSSFSNLYDINSIKSFKTTALIERYQVLC